MNPVHQESGLPRRHHHHVHLHLDPRHHHHVHIHLFHHHHHAAQPLVPPPPANLDRHAHPAPVFFPNAYPAAAPWQPEPPRAAAGEAEGGWDPEPALHAERAEEAEEEEEPVFVLTDEWAEFFAKSEAKRRLAKQQKKNRGKR
ncbi:hypothetical protein ACP70R_038877 [Stipagrostis hirtigluma subsp. patula]